MDQKQIDEVIKMARIAKYNTRSIADDGTYLYDYVPIGSLFDLLEVVEPIATSMDNKFLDENPTVEQMLQWPIEDIAEKPNCNIYKLHSALKEVIKTRKEIQNFPEQFQKDFQAFAKKFKEMYPKGRRVRYHCF